MGRSGCISLSFLGRPRLQEAREVRALAQLRESGAPGGRPAVQNGLDPAISFERERLAGEAMAYFLLVMGKAGVCRCASSHRNNAGWHDATEIRRPLSGSGYQYQGRDELKRRVEVKMVSEPIGRQIADLLSRETVVPWVVLRLAAASPSRPRPPWSDGRWRWGGGDQHTRQVRGLRPRPNHP